MSTNLSYEWLSEARVMVLYQGADEASDAEWEPYLETLKVIDRSAPVRILAYTEGGRPTREQQQRIKAVEKQGWLVAVVSPSTAVRFVVSVFALELPTIRLFSPEQLDEACSYLGCSTDAVAGVRAAIDRARLAVDPSRIAGSTNPHAKAIGRIRSRPLSLDVSAKRRL